MTRISKDRRKRLSWLSRRPRSRRIARPVYAIKISTLFTPGTVQFTENLLSNRTGIGLPGEPGLHYEFAMQAGIVGLPNVGKSTLFNALTRTHKAVAANYPFCTIEPNVGMVTVPDPRLERLFAILHPAAKIPAGLEIVDIAGLVAGASHGEGLGNQFLAHIREVDAIIQVVRCFTNADVVHPTGLLDPVRDIEIVNTELVLADLQSCQAQLDRQHKKAKGHDKEALASIALLERLIPHLNNGSPARLLDLHEDERLRIRSFFLLTAKPVLFVCNIGEEHLAQPAVNPLVAAVAEYARSHQGAASCTVCAQLESDLADLSPAEAADYLREMGVADSGAHGLINAVYELLGLSSFFTANEKEVRAWTFRRGMKAPACAGLIHGDFERGFIKAEVVHFPDLDSCGSVAHARETGRYRVEGRDYEVRDGDFILFRFHV